MLESVYFDYLRRKIKHRLDKEFLKAEESNNNDLNVSDDGEFDHFIKKNHLSESEITILLTALIPHISPEFFNNIIAEYLPNGGDFPEFGGVKGKNHRGILPTGETVLYILAGKDVEKRSEVAKLFDEDHLFARKSVVYIEQVPVGEPKMSGRLIMDEEYVDLFLSGKISRPKLSSDFPAQLIKTELEWKDLVLQEKTLDEIKEMETWLNYNSKLLDDWEMHGKIKPGYRILFHGPPGTGKTMTACLLGKYTNRDVFRVDLSMVVSKYIGETEKNLSKLFDKAANKDWILFFDEADSIFGKRTNVRDAHDKYANQEVSYLLQRIEAHAGLVILASNMKANIDSSFTRRFNTFVEFEQPGVNERKKLWENYIPESIKAASDLNLNEIAKNYDLSGANIVNSIQFAGLQTLQKNNTSLKMDDLLKGIRKEYKKEGKMLRKT
ncbi:ATP-binding protein [Prolixibacteraceae bacterium Z1-6]|uniref:ATP-binding protein n=1 Tax=Draconibacterium aestuarii TaxID=2998507 RepID=A0A9X3F1R2_9BACT|nr:ATP-binding protein [Prolixibacteraceae bacterium Z1-6]